MYTQYTYLRLILSRFSSSVTSDMIAFASSILRSSSSNLGENHIYAHANMGDNLTLINTVIFIT